MLGVWSLVTAAAAIGQISNFGFANSMVRFIPELLHQKDFAQIRCIFGTVTVLNFSLSLPLLAVLYYPALGYADALLDQQQFKIFSELIIWVLAGLFLNNLFSAYSALLDANEFYSLRCIILIIGWGLFLVFGLLLMKQFGLKGVSIAFFFKNLFQLFLAALTVTYKKLLPGGISFAFRKVLVQKVATFGIQHQAISLLVVFFDPLVKYFITQNVSLSATANYEFSNKIAMQARNLLVSANQVLIPGMVLKRQAQQEKNYFAEKLKINTVVSVAAGFFTLSIAPVAVYVLSGKYDPVICTAIILANYGCIFNMITSVHYYTCIALDRQRYLIAYHFMLSFLSALLYLLAGYFKTADLVYYAIPAVVMGLGSLYNSFLIRRIIPGAFSWIRSPSIILAHVVMILWLVIRPDSMATALLFLATVLSFYLLLFWPKIKYLWHPNNNRA